MKRFFLAAVLVCSIATQAQETGEDKWGTWLMYFGTNKVAQKWSIHSEAQFRYYQTISNFNQLLLRTAANYHINHYTIASVGYGYINTDPTFEDISSNGDPGTDRDIRIKEHRIFEQFILKNKVWELLFEHRYRLEQRFISFGDRNSDNFSKSTQHRARYRLQMTVPLTHTFFLNFYDELFINLQDQAFGQNRLYAAAGIHITENSSIQIGYLKNHFNTANFDRLQIGVFFNPDLRKKK